MNRVTMRSWKILCWNVRGLNSNASQRSVREKVTASQCGVVCLQETKLLYALVRLLKAFALLVLISLLNLPRDELPGVF